MMIGAHLRGAFFQVFHPLEDGSEIHDMPRHHGDVNGDTNSDVEVYAGVDSYKGRSATVHARNKSRLLAVPIQLPPTIVATAAAATVPVPPRCFAANGVEYCLPTIVGVCCIRSGSTALAEYLNAHPFLSYGKTSEEVC